jgi:hypothetical protein
MFYLGSVNFQLLIDAQAVIFLFTSRLGYDNTLFVKGIV